MKDLKRVGGEWKNRFCRIFFMYQVVKVRLQTETGVKLKEQRSTYSTAREIVKADGFGLKGINKGLTSTLGRHGVFNMIYFSFYHNVKDAFPVLEDPVQEFGRKFLIGNNDRYARNAKKE